MGENFMMGEGMYSPKQDLFVIQNQDLFVIQNQDLFVIQNQTQIQILGTIFLQTPLIYLGGCTQ